MSRLRPAARAAFVVYAIALLTATHWPGVTIEGPVPRPDVWIHVAAYAVFTALLACTGWAGPARKVRTALVALALGAAWGGFDELTQPMFGRQADWADWLGDLLGCALGAVVGTMLAPGAGGRGE